jgi:hypothetical protein
MVVISEQIVAMLLTRDRFADVVPGTVGDPAQDHGFLYGTSSTDTDGHVWDTMWMDPSAVQ